MSHEEKLGFSAAWAMAVGGMVGGGIFSTLGVVIGIAGSWAWLSFAAAGLVALAAGYSYVSLADTYGEGGGAFTFFRRINATGFAGSLSWVLVIGYVLTNAVYASTFGEYLGYVVGLGPWFPKLASSLILVGFMALNLRGVGEAGGVEVVLVWFKLAVLTLLAAWGLAHWEPSMLSRGVPDTGIAAALFGAASVFMAYEGFQLLTYDYDDLRDPGRTLRRAVLSSVAVVIVLYIAVAVGTAMLIGADQIVEHQEVALAVAGHKAFGLAGLIVVTIGAAFSTGSAINSTLFATARLAYIVAEDGELPGALDHENRFGQPDRAVLGFGVMAVLLAAAGNLEILVEAASLAFLFTFAAVSALAFREHAGRRAITGCGALAASAATLALVVRLARHQPFALAALAVLVVIAVAGRSIVLRELDRTSR